MNNHNLENKGFATKAIHGGKLKKDSVGALATPIYQTSTFVFDSAEQGGRRFASEEDGYIYARLGHPNLKVIETKMALFEGGEDAVATSSGMGAVSSAIWAVIKAGDHIVADKTIYGCTFSLLNECLPRFNVEVTFVDASNIEEVKNAIKENTKIVFLETPANPTLKLCDISAISELAHSMGDITVMVDNTFATPYIQRPIELGADVSIHSATKYLNGHGDVIAGFVVGSKPFIAEVANVALKDMTGSILGAFEAFLIERGLKTLELRMERHCANAQKVAEYLEQHEKVERVYFPGLASFAQNELYKRQMSNSGAVIAFEVKGGYENGKTVINSVELIPIAVSLGDAETLIQHPASMTHSGYNPEERKVAGIGEGLIRLSVGLESVEDIIADLEQALARI